MDLLLALRTQIFPFRKTYKAYSVGTDPKVFDLIPRRDDVAELVRHTLAWQYNMASNSASLEDQTLLLLDKLIAAYAGAFRLYVHSQSPFLDLLVLRVFLLSHAEREMKVAGLLCADTQREPSSFHHCLLISDFTRREVVLSPNAACRISNAALIRINSSSLSLCRKRQRLPTFLTATVLLTILSKPRM